MAYNTCTHIRGPIRVLKSKDHRGLGSVGRWPIRASAHPGSRTGSIWARAHHGSRIGSFRTWAHHGARTIGQFLDWAKSQVTKYYSGE